MSLFVALSVFSLWVYCLSLCPKSSILSGLLVYMIWDTPLSNTIGYIRVSSEDQAESHLSLDAQKQQIEAYCTFKGLSLTQILCDEAISGGKPIQSRPAGSELFTLIDEGNTTAVVATKLDRLFRDALDCLQVNAILQASNVHLHLLDLNVDTSNAMGKAFLTIAAAFAELELNRGKERTRDALRALKERGVDLVLG